ncbi:MAG: penicillin-binding protein 1C, partial [Deltaproteobacteria bacterium]
MILGLVASLAWLVPLPDRLAMRSSSVVRWRDGRTAFLTLSEDERWRVPVEVDEVDPAYVDALIRLEDRRFWWHPGVDPIAVVRAAAVNLARGRVVSGASTITMQVVRLCEPRPRTLASKLVEAARAVQLELRMSKTEILSAYLDLVPMGGNLEGVEAASHAFFGHGADNLDAAEIAVLLAIPQDPTHRAPAPDHVETLAAARDAIARRLLAEGLLEPRLADGADGGAGSGASSPPVPSPGEAASAEEVLARIQATPVPDGLRPMPRQAPHAAAWLLGGPQVSGQDLVTTLDAGVQRRVEAVVADARGSLHRRGIDDVAVVVVRHRDGQVLALVGGHDFWAARDGAQIPAFAVPRSPGSALKPVLYAQALDAGMVLPEQLVLDVPVDYSGYTPENYSGEFDGMVPLQEALSRSLNVPFVRLLHQVGVESFLGQLRGMGVTSLSPVPGHYGLSAVVGGVELTPLDLARIYATIAEGGRARPLRWLEPGAPADPSVRVMSPGAAWLTIRALSRRDRPDFPGRGALSAMPRHIHWKTGTSFGNRDAWAVGSGARMTVVVWLGNLDRRPAAALVGAQAAGPLLFDILDALNDGFDQDPVAAWTRPPDLRPVEVCALSGMRAGPACPETREVPGLEAHVPPTRCTLH